MDLFLSMHLRDDFDCRVELAVVVPFCQVGQTFLEEGGLEVLEEVDALKAFNCGGGDVLWSAAVGWATTGEHGDLVGGGILRGGKSHCRGGEECERCDFGIHC